MRLSFSLGAWLPVLRGLPGPRDGIALSYDDGPNPDSTPRLLDALDRFDAKATFFLAGPRMEKAPRLVAELAARGHAVFGHGWDHVRLDRVPTSELIAALDRAENFLTQFRPTPAPYLVRLPYGGGYRSARVHNAIRRWRADSQMVHWGASLEDHDLPDQCQDPADIKPACEKAVASLFAKANPAGAILLMHDQPIGKESPLAGDIVVCLTETLLTEMRARNLKAKPVTALAYHPVFSRFVLT